MEDLYPGIHETESGSAGYEQFRAHMNRFSYEMQSPDRLKKRKKKKNSEKELKRRMKMLEFQYEQRMRELEAEQQQMLYALQAIAMQQSMLQQNAQYPNAKPAWWQSALASSLPNLVNMGSVVLNNVTKKQPQILNNNRPPIYLSNGSDMK